MQNTAHKALFAVAASCLLTLVACGDDDITTPKDGGTVLPEASSSSSSSSSGSSSGVTDSGTDSGDSGTGATFTQFVKTLIETKTTATDTPVPFADVEKPADSEDGKIFDSAFFGP
jgi:hypothetical protein